jgi:hypothetical protein
MRGILRFASLAVLALLAASCASHAPPAPPMAVFAFENANALLIPAGKVSLVDNYKPPLVPPNIEQNHEARPALIVRRWAAARVKPIASAPGTLTLTILDASVIEQPREVKTDWKHIFSRQAEKTLTANLAWRIAYDGPSLTWHTDGTATATQSVLEQSSLNEADADYNAMVESLAAAFDARAQQQLGELSDALAKTGGPVSKN